MSNLIPDEDPDAAAKARDEGIAKVKANSVKWRKRALKGIPHYRGEVATGEQLRLFIVRKIGEPHNPNVMGALIRQALQLKLIARTGAWEHMKTKKSHGRMTPTYYIK